MADEPDMADASPAARSKRRALLRVGAGAAGCVALLLGGLWLARKPIALHFIDQALQDKGVPGSFSIARIGPRTQRLEHVRLGDPKHPDLIADWIEVDLGYGFSGIGVTGLRAGGIRLQASFRNGTFSLDSLDRLIPKSGGKAALPNIDAEINDARFYLDSDYGKLEIPFEGGGNVRSGFVGRMDMFGPRLSFAGCALDRPVAHARIETQDGQLGFKGPVSAQMLDCPGTGLRLVAPRLDPDLRADPALSDINGAVALAATEARLGARAASTLSGLVTVKGSSEELRGSAAFAAKQTALGVATTGEAKLGGNYALRPSPKDQDYSYSGTLTAENVSSPSQPSLKGIETQLAGTPLGPLATKLAGALRSASKTNRLTVSGRVTGEGRAMQLLVNSAQFSAASGARVATRDGSRFSLNLPKADWSLDGSVETGGGGLPEATLAIASKPGGALAGKLTLKDYRAVDARLGLAPANFLRASDGAWRVNTVVSLDGPIGNGAVKGLQAPLDVTITAKGAFQLPRDCVPLQWASLRIASASIDPAKLDLCGIGDSSARIANVALRGKLGESPFSLKAKAARYLLDTGKFDLTDLDARIGAGEAPVVLHAATLEGALAKNGALAGTLAGATALIGAVPFDLSAIAGKWQFTDGALALDGSLRVADTLADRRFDPLAVNDAHLALKDGKVAATGTLTHPVRKLAVAKVMITHDLGSGLGHADFTLDNLRFGSGLQPDDLTPMALGVIVNVDGVVQGGGNVRWSSEGVTASTGDFSMQDMNFAAAFGPVTGFATKLHFTDLLALKTAPHQQMTVKQVSAGVDVHDGVIDYAILSKDAAQIESGRWPFSGGTLELLPATLNLDSRLPRHLTFRVTGLDAGAFIQTMQLENISATGTFDGLFPMIFDERGGRIEGGVLVARQVGLQPLILRGTAEDMLPVCDVNRQGGDLSYVGPVSDAELGTMGKLAFDVLKHLGYKCLTVRLDGALDGEFVTLVSVNGINRGSDAAKNSFLTRPFLNLPFIFNVRIEAPFRGLLGTAASFSDPRALVREELDKQNAAAADGALAVQPADSDKRLEGKHE